MEPWLEHLRAGVDAGYWERDAASDISVPLPKSQRGAFFEELAGRRALNAEAMAWGHLESPDGHLVDGLFTPTESRVILGLDRIGRDSMALDVRWFWADDRPEDTAVSWSFCDSKVIAVACRVWSLTEREVLAIFRHCLGHCAMGTRDDDVATAWAKGRYIELSPRKPHWIA